MKALMIGDFHLCPQWTKKFAEAVDATMKSAYEERPDIILVCGDLFNGSVRLDDPTVIEMGKFLRGLSRVAPVVGVYGTLSHDVPGILDVYNLFHSKAEFPVVLASKPRTVAVYRNRATGLCLITEFNAAMDPQLNLDLVAYISLLPVPGLSAERNDPVQSAIDRWIAVAETMHGAVPADKPHILVSHLSVNFCGIRTGLVIPAEKVPKFDLVALGHEHTAPHSQDYPWIWYTGSLFPTEANDFSMKALRYATIDDTGMHMALTPLPAKPFVKIHIRSTYVEEDIKAFREKHNLPDGVISYRAHVTIEMPMDYKVDEANLAEAEIRRVFLDPVFRIISTQASKARIPELASKPTFVEKFQLWADNQVPVVAVTQELSTKLYHIKDIGL
jgi:DNA repair exonuclease SbcCD nuclease subunit